MATVQKKKLIIRHREPVPKELVDLRKYNGVNGGNGGNGVGETSSSSSSSSSTPNVITVMGQLIEHTEAAVRSSIGEDKRKNQFRLTQFKKAMNTLRSSPVEITSGAQARQLPGIGKGIGDRIDEIIKTGTLAELSVQKPIDETTRVMNELTSVTGIGEANAKRFIELGVKGLDDLRQKVAAGGIKLTHHMLVGMRYYDDFNQKIPFAEVAELGTVLKKTVHNLYPEIMVEVCGSHRRQKAFSGDIDVLMTTPQIVTENDLIKTQTHYLKEIVATLKKSGFIVDDLTSQGDTKYMGVCLHPVTKIGRRIDIRLVTYDSFYPAILYFTGSMMLNKIMRTIALQKQYTLNEYGLFRTNGGEKEEKIVVASEKEIFDLLGLLYLEPVEREIS